MGYKYIDEDEAHERYDSMLDEVNGEIRIGELTFQPSRVLQEVDPIAYRCGFNDWLDGERLTIDEDEAEPEDDEDDEDDGLSFECEEFEADGSCIHSDHMAEHEAREYRS